ncbi:MAG: hypothetical protein NZL92_00015 [Gloeomargarita sp. SKYG116]|nr:hypothetical protein [Gloeomargarita sp. SKYG116]MDW8400061.1 hypothetical protein [Gloeomargarita sp. SKYGB_i_bin116]
MAPLHIAVEAPAYVLIGLASGELERIGGVIRNAQTKQVVMWLRDAGATPAQAFLGMTTAASWLNLGVAAVGFALVIEKLNKLEKALQSLQQITKEISDKIDLSFYANFRAAVDLAQNAFRMQQTHNRRTSAMTAINRFLEAQHIYSNLARQQLPYKTKAIATYLHTLYLAYVVEARCYLELEELDTARQRLEAGYRELNQLLRQYVDILLTDRPVIYLHPKLSPQVDLTRLTHIFRWKHQNYRLTENEVFELLRRTWLLNENYDIHVGYWIDNLPPAVISQTEIDRNLFGVTPAGREKVFQRLAETVNHIESLLETDQRFLGYQLEVQALQQQGVSFRAFQDLKPEGTSLPPVVYIYPES